MAYGHPIEKPKTAAALRVYDLVEIFDQAEVAWLGLASAVAEGYSKAWNTQHSVLDDIKKQIQAQIDSANFIISILAAGVAGGLAGAVMGAIIKEDVKKFVSAMVAASTVSEASKRTANRYLVSAGAGGDQFTPAGPEPSTYSATLQKNVSVLFSTLFRLIRQIIQNLESESVPYEVGDQYYNDYMKLPFIKDIPDDRDMNQDFEKTFGLGLWIAWGGQRDFNYWNRMWKDATQTGFMANGMVRMLARAEIDKWGRPILAAIHHLDPYVAMTVRNYWDNDRTVNHLDIRKLKDMGDLSDKPSLKALSNYYDLPKKHWTALSAWQTLQAVDPDMPKLGLAW